MVLKIFSSFDALMGGNKSTLQLQLSKATDSGVIEIPKDLFEDIMEASAREESRRVIIMHIFDCFTQTKAKAWRRVHAALMLAQDLVLNVPVLVAEFASGHHFDLLQQLAFLEHFACTDSRAQTLVRSKAKSARQLIAPKLQDICLEDYLVAPETQLKEDKDCFGHEDTQSTCSSAGESLDMLKDVQGEWLTKKGSEVKISGSVATWSSGTTGSLSADDEFLYLQLPNDEGKYHAYLRTEDGVLCWSDGDFWRRPVVLWTDGDFKQHVPLQAVQQEWHGVLLPPKPNARTSEKVVIHGLVSLGHSIDTDTESESSAHETPTSGRKSGQRSLRTRRERTEKSSLTSPDSQEAGEQQILDLLS